jgi:hypothetical protein
MSFNALGPIVKRDSLDPSGVSGAINEVGASKRKRCVLTTPTITSEAFGSKQVDQNHHVYNGVVLLADFLGYPDLRRLRQDLYSLSVGHLQRSIVRIYARFFRLFGASGSIRVPECFYLLVEARSRLFYQVTHLRQNLTRHRHYLFHLISHRHSVCMSVSNTISRKKFSPVSKPTICSQRRARCSKRYVVWSCAYGQIVAIF